MAVSKFTRIDEQSEIEQLRDVIALAAFAVEARRVLSEIELMASHLPKLDEQLSQAIEARRQWMTHDDNTAEVLNAVARQLDTLAKAMEEEPMPRRSKQKSEVVAP